MTYAMDGNGVGKAVVKISEEEDNLTVTLNIADRVRTLNRPKNEALGRSLRRLRLSLFPDKKRAGKQDLGNAVDGGVMEHATVALYASESDQILIDEDLPNEVAWRNGKWLVAGHMRYEVLTNPPSVKELILNEIPIVGHPIYPLCKLQFADASTCQWRWFRRKTKEDQWEALEATERVYQPDSNDAGYYVGVECTPFSNALDSVDHMTRSGNPQFAETGPVAPGKAASSGDGRHELTTHPLKSPDFRVVTYNILADSYVSRPNYNPSSTCSAEDYQIDIRKQRILKELLGYHADIICLQECDKSVFETYFQHHMSNHGFHCMFSQKTGSTKEGEAMFVRKSRFTVVEEQSVPMNKILEPELPAYLKPFEEMISSATNMRQALTSLVTVAQVALLQPEDPREKCLSVINTHLISKAHGEHIRMLHVLTMLHKAMELKEAHGVNAQILLIGDLNSCIQPETGLADGCITLLRDGCISAQHWEWKQCKKFCWKRFAPEDDIAYLQGSAEEEEQDPIEGIDLTLPLRLESTIDLVTPYSNYTEDFKGLLDYVWYDPTSVEPVRSIPIPTPEQLRGPCPSDVYPSDHLAVVVELRFKDHTMNGMCSAQSAGNGRVEPARLDNLETGIQALRAEQIIGVPTDTIYGLAADAGSGKAIDALYSIKGRSLAVPLSVCVGRIEDIASVCEISHLPEQLLESLLPGPVTVILKRKEHSSLSSNLNPGVKTLGVRVPHSEFILQLCEAFGGPIALTSANLSGEPSSVRIADFKKLWNECSVVFDGGEVSASLLGSTVIDLSYPDEFRIVRAGDGSEAVLRLMDRFSIPERQ